MRVNICELIGFPLDWATAVALGWRPYVDRENYPPRIGVYSAAGLINNWNPSDNPGQSWQLIEEGIETLASVGLSRKVAASTCTCRMYDGPTYVIAGLRAVVGTKMGDYVEIPDEVCELQRQRERDIALSCQGL